MSSKVKSNYHHGDLHASLISAAVEMITQQGIESITMRSLSEWIGVSRTAAYRHFDNKEALLTATAIAGFEQFSAALRTARLNESSDEFSRFKEMGEAYLQFAVENQAYYRLMFGDTVAQQSDLLSAAAESACDELLFMIETLQENKLITIKAPRIQAIYVWSLMHGLASLIINDKLQADDDMPTITTFFNHAIRASLQHPA